MITTFLGQPLCGTEVLRDDVVRINHIWAQGRVSMLIEGTNVRVCEAHYSYQMDAHQNPLVSNPADGPHSSFSGRILLIKFNVGVGDAAWDPRKFTF